MIKEKVERAIGKLEIVWVIVSDVKSITSHLSLISQPTKAVVWSGEIRITTGCSSVSIIADVV